jgi:cation-transporting P-type ATPase E
VFQFAIPVGVVAAAATFSTYALARSAYDVSLAEARTAATITLLGVGLWVLGLLARPFTPLRALLVATMAGAFAGALAIPAVRDFFALELPPLKVDLVVAAVVVIADAVLELGWRARHDEPVR